MAKEEFLGSRESNGCGGLTALFTEKLDNNLVTEIDFKFSSGTAPAEMIVSVSDQFGAKPTKSDWSAEIKYAIDMHQCPGRHPTSLADFACVGGTIAQWRLDNSLKLNLTLNSPAAGTRPTEYILSLSSDAIASMDAQAEKSRRNDQEMRTRVINPNQRF